MTLLVDIGFRAGSHRRLLRRKRQIKKKPPRRSLRSAASCRLLQSGATQGAAGGVDVRGGCQWRMSGGSFSDGSNRVPMDAANRGGWRYLSERRGSQCRSPPGTHPAHPLDGSVRLVLDGRLHDRLWHGLETGHNVVPKLSTGPRKLLSHLTPFCPPARAGCEDLPHPCPRRSALPSAFP